MGYINFEDLTDEIVEILLKVQEMPENLQSLIDPQTVTETWYSEKYPVGASKFAVYYNSSVPQPTDDIAKGWIKKIYGLGDSDPIPSTTLVVSTVKILPTDLTSALAVQSIDVMQNGVAEGQYFRTVLNDIWNNFSQYPAAGITPIKDPIVLKVNEREPDENGNVDTDYRIIDPIEVTEPPTAYPYGSTDFVVEREPKEGRAYTPAEQSWIDMFPPTGRTRDDGEDDNEESSRINVRTYKDTRNTVFLQEVDSDENGYYEPSHYRYSEDGLVWSEFLPVPIVKSVNNIFPDENGNIVLTTQGGEFVGDPPVLSSYYKLPTDEEGTVTTFDYNIPDYNPETDVLDFFIQGFHMPPEHVVINSYNDPVMNVTLLDGRSIDSGRRFEALKARFSYSPRLDASVIDHLDSESSTDALSARQGKILYEYHRFLQAKVDGHIARGYATDNFVGHVKPDGTTITVNENGVISATGSYDPDELPKATTEVEGIVQLTNDTDGVSEVLAVTQKGIKDAVETINTSITEITENIQELVDADYVKTVNEISPVKGNVTIPKASSTTSGVVMVDGVTVVSNDGVLTANTTGDFRINNNIKWSDAPSTYLEGRTISYVDDTQDNYYDWMNSGFVQSTGAYRLKDGEGKFVITTDNLNGVVTQNVDVYLNQFMENNASNDKFLKMLTLTRVSNPDLASFKRMGATANVIVRRIAAGDVIYGVQGTMYYNLYTSLLMGKRIGSGKNLDSDNWVPINDYGASIFSGKTLPTKTSDVFPKIQQGSHFLKLDTLELYQCGFISDHDADPPWKKIATFEGGAGIDALPIASLTEKGIVQLTNEPGGESDELALAQSAGKKLGDAISLLSTSIDDHIDKMASKTVLGHVKIDDSTIKINEDGVISATATTWQSF